MAKQIAIGFAVADKVGGDAPDDAYYVRALVGPGKFMFHEGPREVEFFTREQAESLAVRVNAAKSINAAHWYR
jgi:hypothetical protein